MSPQALFVAKGDRDSVQPVVALARQHKLQHNGLNLTLVTHRDHKVGQAFSAPIAHPDSVAHSFCDNIVIFVHLQQSNRLNAPSLMSAEMGERAAPELRLQRFLAQVFEPKTKVAIGEHKALRC